MASPAIILAVDLGRKAPKTNKQNLMLYDDKGICLYIVLGTLC